LALGLLLWLAWPIGLANAAGLCDANVQTLDFSELDLDRPREIIGTVVVSCFGKADFELLASEGLGGSYGLREMRNADGVRLRYNLFTDPARTQVWGDGIAAGTAKIPGGNSRAGPAVITLNFYGRIPAGQPLAMGDYADAITVTLREK
jgi:spore coat protein U-like protein